MMRIPSQSAGDQVWGTTLIDHYIQNRKPKAPHKRKPQERKGLFAQLTEEETNAIALVLPPNATKGYAVLFRLKNSKVMAAVWAPNYLGIFGAGSGVTGKITRTVKLSPAMVGAIYAAQANSLIP
jgi:hypothetical protein